MTSSNAPYDAIIIGGGPAGTAAALALHQREHTALLVEAGSAPQPGPCAGWLSPAAVRLCREFGISAQLAGGAEFSGLRLCSWDFSQCVDVHESELNGWVVQPAELSSALLAAVEAAGIEVRRNLAPQVLDLGESAASVTLAEDQQVTGQVVVIADGHDSPTARQAQLLATTPTDGAARRAITVYDVDNAGVGVDVIIGAGRALKVATIVRNHTRLRATLFTKDPEQPPQHQLTSLLEAGGAAGVLPPGTERATHEAPALAGAALDRESHVGKRCVIIGDAGGFVSAFSQEGIYPALRSGMLAAETISRSLRAPVLQDELATFSTAWRSELAEYLRLPNTDLGLLMPMVFNNPQMSRRVARAFLLGQAF